MSLTGANAVIMLTIPNLFQIPNPLQGFAADDIFDVDQVKRAELLMGVDGILSGGFVWEQVRQTFALQADSPSMYIFDQWQLAEQAISDKYPCSATFTLTGINTQFSAPKGFLSAASPAPGVGKLIKPRKFTIEWQQVTPVVIPSIVQTVL